MFLLVESGVRDGLEKQGSVTGGGRRGTTIRARRAGTGFERGLGDLLRLKGGGQGVLRCRRVDSFFESVGLSRRGVRGILSFLRTGGMSILEVDSKSSRSSSVVLSSRSRMRMRGVSLSIPRNMDIRSPMHVCLGRVKGIPLLSTSRRVRLTRGVRTKDITIRGVPLLGRHLTRANRRRRGRRVRTRVGTLRLSISHKSSTGGHLTRTGLHLMIDVTGHCINENVLFLSLVRRKGLKLVGTMRGFSCHGKCGFSACTA